MILITGGAGYIGSCFAWACRDAGLPFVVMDNLSTGHAAAVPPGAPLEIGDVGDKQALRRVCQDHGVDAVVHFAGSVLVEESVSRPELYYVNNTMATLGLVETLCELGIKSLIFSSTAAVYGTGQSDPVDESAPTRPSSPYGWSKLFAEQIIEDMAAAHELNFVILRYFNVAGADPLLRTGLRARNATHLLKVCSEVACQKRDEVVIFGDDYPTRDGTGVRDYIHVADLVNAHLKALEYLFNGGTATILNCGYGRGVSVREALTAFEGQVGHALPHRVAARRPGDTAQVIADNARIKATLGWRGEYEAIEAIVSSMLQWEDRVRQEHGRG